ncbi:MAG TPA: PQQ-binding-like beta-propeller repeat protein, partial [Ktedonobacteraceae bacterium]|nr:PQQ-binding-like beta-propeller repeat protein [Ktedonobacteraceae bacterium]
KVEAPPVVANGVVYVGSDDGRLYALDASTGNMLWNTMLGNAATSSVAIANGVVYIGSDDGKLYAFH